MKGSMIPDKISIIVLTYNHVEYIRECIESILAQTVNCHIEIIIGNDGSTDGTTALIEEII